ncbi:hypothetical protein BH11ARM2_BH11ARM2_00200 [soil metagenome]
MLPLLAATVFALAVNETPKVPFGAAWSEASKAGIRATTLALNWSQVEPKPGEYDLTWPKAAEGFYPGQGAQIGLVLRDLNTTRDERPLDLRALPYDDPKAIQRWTGMADVMLGAMPKTTFSWIAVGNEVDGVLNDDAKVASYARFLKAAFAHLRKTRPGVRLGTCLTFDGVKARATALKPILEAGDVAMVNYYLIDAAKRPAKTQVPRDLDAMEAFAGKKPLLLTETGAPSGTLCGSSEAAQKAFVETMMEEARKRKLPYVAFDWMNDIGEPAAGGFGTYYGTSDPAFTNYLATLGLRHEDGTPKPAWTAFTERLK